MNSLLSDLRYAAREVRNRPSFTLTAVLSLALGIAATSAVFSVIYAVLLDPFPYPGANRMMEIRLTDKSGQDRFSGLNGPEIQLLRQTKSLESVVALGGWNLTTTDGDLPEDVRGMDISPEAPNHWDSTAMMGRWLIPSDAPFGQDAQAVVVLSYPFWQRYYLGDPNVVGRTLQLVHKPYKIVGVMGPRFRWGEGDVYLPLKLTNDPRQILRRFAQTKAGRYSRPGERGASAASRSVRQANAHALSHRYVPRKSAQYHEIYARPLGPILYLLLGAVGSLLLIGCGNVSILLLARGTERQHELAVRAAVGASRWQMIRQLLTESLSIAVAGTLLGVLLAWKSLAFITAWLPKNAFAAESVIKMNVPVLLFSIALACATTIVFGLWPALQLSRPDLARLMQSSTRRISGSARARRTHSLMVGAQVALTLLMVTAASAAGKGFLKLVKADLGYDPHFVMSVPIPIHENTHNSWKERSEYFDQLRARLASMPEVAMAAISTNATPPSNGNDNRFEIMGINDGEKHEARLNLVSPEYFPLLHIPLAQGRLWDHAETMRGATVAVINQTMARQYWPNGNALGQRLRTSGLKAEPLYAPAAPGSDDWLQIIGVVADVRDDGLRNPIKPAVYIPYTLKMWMFTQVLVRTHIPPLSVLRDIRAQIVQVDPDQQVISDVRDLEGWITNLPEYGTATSRGYSVRHFLGSCALARRGWAL